LGITGPNGTGKSTLLRLLMGEVATDSGQVEWHSRANIGYYAQEARLADTTRTVLDEIKSTSPKLSEERVRTLLGAFLLSGDAVFKRMGDLSGGEQSRVRLVKLLMSSPSVLVLDEPTNHLDIPSREAVEEALTQYAGTLIVVSHDRFFLDRVVDRLLVMRTDGHRFFAGNYSFYIDQIERERRVGRDEKPLPPRPKTVIEKQPGERATRKFDSMSVDDIEARLMEQEAVVANLQSAFGDPDLYRNADALAQLRSQLQAAQEDLALLEQAWLERVEES
jgi:ATP-binding cassette subfamily F protein 3